MPIYQKGGDAVAVKVIRYGHKKYVTCGFCDSFIEYEKEDVKTVQTGMNEYEGIIICPNCREKVRVKG